MKLTKRVRKRYSAAVTRIRSGESEIPELERLSRDHDIDLVLEDGLTLLMTALRAENESAALAVVSAGAGANRLASTGPLRLPLFEAAYRGLVHAAAVLIEKGANVDLLTDDGRTLVQVAEQGEHPEHAPTFARWMKEFTLKGIEV